jgi:hypothetical protein
MTKVFITGARSLIVDIRDQKNWADFLNVCNSAIISLLLAVLDIRRLSSIIGLLHPIILALGSGEGDIGHHQKLILEMMRLRFTPPPPL